MLGHKAACAACLLNNIPWLLRNFRFDLIRFPNADFTPLDFFTAFDKANDEAQAYAIAAPAPLEWTPTGKTVEIGALRLSYVRTSLKVLSTNWLYEATTRTLFTSDSFGFPTRRDKGGPKVVEPGGAQLAVDDIVDASNTKFDWLCGSDTTPMIAELRALMGGPPIDRVCPSYGCIIEGRDSVGALLERGIEALEILGARPKPSVLAGFDWDRCPAGTLA